MGRIAEALKRAQAERAQLLETGAEADLSSCAVSEPSANAAGAPAAEAAEVLGSILGQPLGDAPRPFTITSAAISPESIGPEVVVLHQPCSPISEKYRSVRTRLLTANANGAMRLLGVTSAAPKEGKTTSVANLGFGLAELRHLRVLMVDLDLRMRGLSALMGAAEEPGICEVLRGERSLAEVCRPAVRTNLYLLTAGDPQGASPSELLAGPAAIDLFRQIQERFQYTLIDTPAAAVADIGLIAPLCQAVMMVIRMNSTPETLVRRSVQMLQANRVPIAGCILAGCRDEISSAEDGSYAGGF
jgi:protein-tyrosine kinase